MKRILLDQGLPSVTARILRERGWDALHTREIDMRRSADASILDVAVAESRIVITLDRDFSALLALSQAHSPSVVFIRLQGMKGSDVASLLEAVWLEYETVLNTGCVLKIGKRGVKVRLLPLR